MVVNQRDIHEPWSSTLFKPHLRKPYLFFQIFVTWNIHTSLTYYITKLYFAVYELFIENEFKVISFDVRLKNVVDLLVYLFVLQTETRGSDFLHSLNSFSMVGKSFPLTSFLLPMVGKYFP